MMAWVFFLYLVKEQALFVFLWKQLFFFPQDMVSLFRLFLVVVLLVGSCSCDIVVATTAQPYVAIAASGDSISVAFNAQAGSCTDANNPSLPWDVPFDANHVVKCASSATRTFSIMEQAICAGQPIKNSVNVAMFGATMVANGYAQAVSIRSNLTGIHGRKKIISFMGHNDACSGHADEMYSPPGLFVQNCNDRPYPIDRDATNFCYYYQQSYERELRRSLDVYITMANSSVTIVVPGRVSQICNLANSPATPLNVDGVFTCQGMWITADTLGTNICRPLTYFNFLHGSCSDLRVTSLYNMLLAYRSSIIAVVAEYNALAVGAKSAVYKFNGVSSGGATKAAVVQINYSDVAWKSPFDSTLIGECDCFHPTLAGQNSLALHGYQGRQCSESSPCCKDDPSNVLASAKCSEYDTTSFIPGAF